MDQPQDSDALNSATSSKLNAEAPEFVPLSSSSAPPPQPPAQLIKPIYARPPAFAHPLMPAFYGYDSCYPQKVVPFFGYNMNPVCQPADAKNGAVVPLRNGLSDAHQKVINQVEFYFSDINLATTDQLFRFMCNDLDGFVPISVVAAFKKIKNSITDNSQLASILRASNKLVVSEDGKKVKRQQPLTESDMEELQARIVVAENLPEDHSHQNLMKIFSSVGRVKSIRTCPPQTWNGASSALKTSKGDALNLSGKLHAFVEYESTEAAEKAVTDLNDDGTWRNGLKVRLLLKIAVKPTHTRTKKVSTDGQSLSKNGGMAETQGEGPSQSDESSNDLQVEDNSKNKKGRKSATGGGGKGKEKGQTRGRQQQHTNGGSSSILGCPPLDSEKHSAAKSSPIPRMPDGTKGFSMGRGKPLPMK